MALQGRPMPPDAEEWRCSAVLWCARVPDSCPAHWQLASDQPAADVGPGDRQGWPGSLTCTSKPELMVPASGMACLLVMSNTQRRKDFMS